MSAFRTPDHDRDECRADVAMTTAAGPQRDGVALSGVEGEAPSPIRNCADGTEAGSNCVISTYTSIS